MNFKSLFLVVSLLSSGCATPFQGGPSQEEFSKADFGSPPISHQTVIQQFMGELLKDPFSAQYQFAAPEKCWYGQEGGLLVSRNIKYGWRVVTRINAKNSFGAYIGWKTYIFSFRGERLEQYNEVY